MRLARRALPYALLGAAALAAAWPILRAKGLPYNVDISGFFPLSPEAYQGRFWPLWNERGGMSTLQFLPALAFELPLLLAGRAFGWDMEVHLKVRIVLGFALAGMSMYALARHHLAKRRPGLAEPIVVLAALAAGLLYMLNPWSVHRVFHYFLWIGYGMAPLVALAFERLADQPTWRRALVLSALLALATTDPHNPVYLALVLVPLGLARLVPLLRRDRAEARRLVGAVGVAACAYVVLAAYWILPYVYNALHNPGFGPTYVMSRQMLDTLSRNGGFWETLRFLNNYLPRGDLWPAGGPALTAWTLASFAVPLLAFGALLLDRSRVAWAYGVLAAGTLFLGMGSRGPLPHAYAWLLFDAPWGEGLSWLFRDPYRWGGLQALAYSVMLALSLGALGAWLSRVRMPHAAPAVGMAAVLLFSGPALASYTHGPYQPVQVPSEYAQANAYLANAPADASAVWMPRMLGPTTWSGDRTLEYFDATSSARPAMGPFRPHTSVYFDFLQDAIKDGAQVAPLLARAGADRIVYHNDVDPASGARAIRQIENLGLVEAGRFGNSSTLMVDQSSMAPTYTPAARFALHGDRELAQSFVPSATSPALLTLRVDDAGSPGPLRVAIVDAQGREAFARNVTMRASDHQVQLSLEGVRLSPGETYAIHLKAMAPSNATSRYDVSYYRADTYAAGSLAGVPGDLAFEILSGARGFAVALVSPEPAPAVREAPRALASAAGLQVLRALEYLPGNGSLRDAPVLFLDADPAAMRAFASGDGSWSWVGDLDDGAVAPLVPFLPKDSFVSPFAATGNADGKAGWARGTQDFTYYSWGWKLAVSSEGQESWGFDGGDGLVYSTTRATLTLPIPAHSEESVVLARVHESPDGGNLSFHAGDTFVGRLDTTAEAARLQWVEVGFAPAGATSLSLDNEGGFQGVDALAVVPRSAFDAARAAAEARMAQTPATLVAQAETVPGLGARTTYVSGVGRVAQVADPVPVALDVPAPGDYTLWLRAPAGTTAPQATLDGRTLDPPACLAGCEGAAAWLAVPLGRLDAGSHALTLADGQVDVIAVSSDPGFAADRAPPATWTKLSATEYRAHVAAPGLVALALPYDPGWVARVASTGERVRSVPVDGVANGFLVQGAGEIIITYEPQAWATAGVVVSLAAALSTLGLVGAAAWRRRSSDPAPEEVVP